MTKATLRELVREIIKEYTLPSVAPIRTPYPNPDVVEPDEEEETDVEPEENPFEPMDPDALPNENPKARMRENEKEGIKKIFNRLKAGK